VVVGSAGGAEGDSRVELHFEGSSMHHRGERRILVIPLMGVLDVVEVGFIIAAGVIGVADGGGWEIADPQVAVIVVGSIQAGLCYILPGVVFNRKGIYICGCVYDWITNCSVTSHNRDGHIRGIG